MAYLPEAADVIGLSEKLAGLQLTEGEAALLAAVVGAESDEVSGFGSPLQPSALAMAMVSSPRIGIDGESADANHGKWIDVLSAVQKRY